ncbi:hypothetical protein Tco_1063417, partial [Tanacetum coccineum]
LLKSLPELFELVMEGAYGCILDGYTRFQHQEQYEHVGLEVTRSQEGKRSQDDDKRLCLVDDLKEAQIHIQVKPIKTSSSLKLKITTSMVYQDEVKNQYSAQDMKTKPISKTSSLDESRSPEFNLFSDLEEYSEEEVAETMAKTIEQYMSKTRADYGSGISRPKIDDKDRFELKGQFLKELCDNTFSGSDHEDANEHFEKVLEIVDLFHIPNITQDQVMLRAFPMSLTGAASH